MTAAARTETELGATGRLVLRVIIVGLHALQRLPDAPLYRLADLAGRLLYRIDRRRRAMARANLRHICAWLVAEGAATPKVARAAADPERLEAMVRDAFGQWLIGYVEGAIAPRYSREDLVARITRMTPEASAEALSLEQDGGLGPIHMSMHFGSVDISALFGARVAPHPLTGPMEQVPNPIARAYFDHVRRELGATIVPLEGASTSLVAVIERGEAVGVVADRNVVGKGSPVTLFGLPLRLPTGPAMLSIATGATIYLHAIERGRPGRWLGHTVVIRTDPGLGRKARLRAILDQEARAFEHLIARAPEQWSTIMFRIWDDVPPDER